MDEREVVGGRARLSDKQLSMLRHMLGINTPHDSRPKPYRNYAAVNPGDPEYLELERLGMVERYREAGNGSSYDLYRCTDEGRRVAMRSHKDIRWSRSKRAYAAYLDLRDALPDLTFKEFLTDPGFADYRR